MPILVAGCQIGWQDINKGVIQIRVAGCKLWGQDPN